MENANSAIALSTRRIVGALGESEFPAQDAHIEYCEAAATYRHYSHLRFVILTLFMTINGCILTMLSIADPHKIFVFAPLIGLFSCFFFFIYHEIVVVAIDAFDKSLIRIEGALNLGSFGYRHEMRNRKYKGRLVRYIFSLRFASRGLFTLSTLFWIVVGSKLLLS